MSGERRMSSWVGGKSTAFLVVLGLSITAGFVLPQTLSTSGGLPGAEPTEASCDTDLTYHPPDWHGQPDSRMLLMRLFLGTASVLGLCVGSLWLCKRWLPGAVPSPGQTPGQLQVVETLFLGNRCCLYLVKADQQSLVAGVDGGGLKSLIALPESFAARFLEASSASAPLGRAESAPSV